MRSSSNSDRYVNTKRLSAFTRKEKGKKIQTFSPLVCEHRRASSGRCCTPRPLCAWVCVGPAACCSTDPRGAPRRHWSRPRPARLTAPSCPSAAPTSTPLMSATLRRLWLRYFFFLLASFPRCGRVLQLHPQNTCTRLFPRAAVSPGPGLRPLHPVPRRDRLPDRLAVRQSDAKRRADAPPVGAAE